MPTSQPSQIKSTAVASGTFLGLIPNGIVFRLPYHAHKNLQAPTVRQLF
ncbi:MAG: hypothetical protein GPJ21_22855 [Microcystis aeruginosa W13-11]|nr:hypothetical protein [Microcystis aeruginosa W13-11]